MGHRLKRDGCLNGLGPGWTPDEGSMMAHQDSGQRERIAVSEAFGNGAHCLDLVIPVGD